MTTMTDSVNLLQPPLMLKDQTTSGDSRTVLIDPTEKTSFAASDITTQFLNCTDDGGTLLTMFSSQFKPRIYSLQDIMSTDLFHYLNSITLALRKFALYSSYVHTFMTGSQPFLIQNNAQHLDALHWIETATGLSQERIGRLIDVTRQAINGWKRGMPIADHNRQRLLAVRDVLERAARRYPTREQLIAWLDIPRGADGRTPAELLAANEINRARLLAVSSPSPRLVRTPEWANRPVPNAFRTRAEHRQEAWSPEIDDKLADLIDNEDESTDEDGEELPLT